MGPAKSVGPLGYSLDGPLPSSNTGSPAACPPLSAPTSTHASPRIGAARGFLSGTAAGGLRIQDDCESGGREVGLVGDRGGPRAR